ncbi:MAG: lipopolysaccharide core heptose(I) kinase RfaP [gamma proteobacterium symbiont of Bathyaustriella thionipta]|nr:lipopolysaccharide core heptose(I) kinase RfaP [gamma proteobacterium symbiont of Bathyaustriella thionipta]
MIWFDADFIKQAWGGKQPQQEQVFSLQGELYRQQPGRKTLRFTRAGQHYFVKLHWPPGYREIIKNLLSLRLPVLGAGNEYRAVRLLQQLALPSIRVVAFAEYGRNPLQRKSYLISKALPASISLEDYCKDWGREAPDYRVKRLLIETLADISRRMHAAGMNHRDYYLCHFLLSDEQSKVLSQGRRPGLYLIDLHRAQIRRRVPQRWLVKDLGSLYFSALDAGLSKRDWLRFVRAYEKQSLPQVLARKQAFYAAVQQRAGALYLKTHGHEPCWPG